MKNITPQVNDILRFGKKLNFVMSACSIKNTNFHFNKIRIYVDIWQCCQLGNDFAQITFFHSLLCYEDVIFRLDQNRIRYYPFAGCYTINLWFFFGWIGLLNSDFTLFSFWRLIFFSSNWIEKMKILFMFRCIIAPR